MTINKCEDSVLAARYLCSLLSMPYPQVVDGYRTQCWESSTLQLRVVLQFFYNFSSVVEESAGEVVSTVIGMVLAHSQLVYIGFEDWQIM